jgi:acetoin utilization protein AcuB
MLVRDRMTAHPTTVRPDTTVADALKLMHREHVRRFPVVDADGTLVGLITEKQLLYASPSPATSLSVHELHYLLSKLTVKDIMSTELVTVSEATLVEEAALLMLDHNVSGLPVMRGETLVGIITETDLFRTFTELFAAREEGLRLTLLVPDQEGQVAAIAQAIAKEGGNIVALGTFRGEDLSNRVLTVKVVGASRQAITSRMASLGVKVLDVRQCLLAQAC